MNKNEYRWIQMNIAEYRWILMIRMAMVVRMCLTDRPHYSSWLHSVFDLSQVEGTSNTSRLTSRGCIFCPRLSAALCKQDIIASYRSYKTMKKNMIYIVTSHVFCMPCNLTCTHHSNMLIRDQIWPIAWQNCCWWAKWVDYTLYNAKYTNHEI